MRLCMTGLFRVGNIILLFTELIKVEFKFEVLCMRLRISAVPKLGVGPPPKSHEVNLRGRAMAKNDVEKTSNQIFHRHRFVSGQLV